MASAINKTVLITSYSKNSIGDALAQEFVRRGHHVLATARPLSKISHLTSMGIEIFELDISSSESIANFRNKITHIDILFNNAGISATSM
jgi:1-acylglycerone phosphate reductase